MTKEQIEEEIAALKQVMGQNPDNVTVIIHCGNKILELEKQLEPNQEKPIVYLPPK